MIVTEQGNKPKDKIFTITDRFYLSEAFLSEFKGKQPNWGYGILSYLTFKDKYARLKDDGLQEEFWECLKRVVEGVFSIQKSHCDWLSLEWNGHKAQHTAQRMFRAMWEFKFLPPGRGLWAMGTEIIEKKGSGCLNNCAFVSTERIDKEFNRPFTFLMDFSMLGVGVGFDCKGAGKFVVREPKGEETLTFVIPDTREGWVEALRLLLESFTGKQKYRFEYHEIRDKGTLIKGFGGIASGPEPLKEMLESIEALLTSLIGKSIDSVVITDIMNMIGKCVVSGNVRRSAEIAIGEEGDEGFIDMKNPELFQEELISHRWASNNSVFCRVGTDYTSIAERIVKNGEPGVVWMENIKTRGRVIDGFDDTDRDAGGLNPCGEQILESNELCNLVETFPANHETADDYWLTLKLAYLYAKTVTLIPTHDTKVNAVMLRNRRIGTSMSGIEQAKHKHGYRTFYRDFADAGYKRIQELDMMYSRWLCVPQSKRTTSVKPSGTVSILAGATPGIHYAHAEYYYRTLRFDNDSPIIKACKKAGYRVEPSVTSKTMSVVYFPIKEDNFVKGKYEVTIWEQMENIVQMQNYWADNSVSCTVTFKESEHADVQRVLEIYDDRLKNISMLPLKDSAHGYKQAPYITIDKEEYEKAMKKIKPIDSIETYTEAQGEKFCNNDTCEI